MPTRGLAEARGLVAADFGVEPSAGGDSAGMVNVKASSKSTTLGTRYDYLSSSRIE